MFVKIKSWYLKLSNPVKAAINTAWQTFVGVFGLALLGFLADVQRWAGDVDGAFPSVSPLGKAAAAAVAAAFSGLVAFMRRSWQAAHNPQDVPKYPTK